MEKLSALDKISEATIVAAEAMITEQRLQPEAVLEGVLRGTARFAAFWQMKTAGGVFSVEEWVALCNRFAGTGVQFLADRHPELFPQPLGSCGEGDDVLQGCDPEPAPRGRGRHGVGGGR